MDFIKELLLLKHSVSCSHYMRNCLLLIIYDLTKLLALYPTKTTVMKEDQCCLETVCQIPKWKGRRRGGRRRGISWDHRGAPRQKGHCGTD